MAQEVKALFELSKSPSSSHLVVVNGKLLNNDNIYLKYYIGYVRVNIYPYYTVIHKYIQYIHIYSMI